MKSIGIIGCGRIAQVRHVPEYADHRDTRPYAFHDLNPERTREFAGTYAGCVCETYEELPGDEKTDAVFIYIFNEFHAKILIAALKAGKDVLREKPIAVTLKERCQIAKVAEETGKCLMIRQNWRLAKGHAFAGKLTEHGDIGKATTFKTTFGHGGPETWGTDSGSNIWLFDKKKVAMGAMTDPGIHKTDLIQYLIGEHAAETTAVTTTLDKRDGNGNLIGVDDNTICIYKMESSAVGTMTASWTYYGQEDNSIILYGSRGIMHIYEDPEYYIKIIKSNNEAILYNVDQIQANSKQTRPDVTDAFMDCIAHGKEVQLDEKSVPSAMEAAFVSIESAKTGETVKIGQGE